MSFYDMFKNLSTDHTFIVMLGKAMACVTPFLMLKDYFRSSLYSLIPSYVESIIHFDTKNAKLNKLYVGQKYMYSIKNAYVDLMDIPENGYYMFHVWNNNRMIYEYYLLKSNIVTKALGIRSMSNIWALHDFGIVELLSNYVQYTLLNSNTKIVGITVNKSDETRLLKPFMNSIHIPNNITPFVLYMLSTYIKCESLFHIDAKHSMCVYSDEDLNEICIKKSNDYLISIEENTKCPTCSRMSFDLISDDYDFLCVDEATHEKQLEKSDELQEEIEIENIMEKVEKILKEVQQIKEEVEKNEDIEIEEIFEISDLDRKDKDV